MLTELSMGVDDDIEEEMIVDEVLAVMSVSYTHLDVYKRQSGSFPCV